MFEMQMGYPFSPYFNPQNGQIMAPGMMQTTPSMQNVPQGGHSATPGDPGWIMAQTVKQIEQVSVQPGQKAWIMVQNEPVFALRTADNMGLITTDYYRFEKINSSAVAEPSAAYVTAEQLEERLAAFADSLKPAMSRGKKEAAE